MQHFTANRALAPAFDQQHPDRLKRLSTMCLRALSTTPDSSGNPRFRRVAAHSLPVGLRVRFQIHESYFIIHYQYVVCLATRRIMKRHATSCVYANELSKLRSQTFARRRQRDIQAKARSTTQRWYRTVNPSVS